MNKRTGVLHCILLFCAALVMTALCCTAAEADGDTVVYDYLLPDSDTREYNLDELRELPVKILAYARNEIYAKHGRTFRSAELQDYFDKCAWYEGVITPSDFDDGILNHTENANIRTIRYLEQRLGTYKLDSPDYGFGPDPVEYILARDGYRILSGLSIYQEDSDTAYIETDEFTLAMPANEDWEIEAIDNDCFEIFYVPSRESMGAGHLVSILAVDPEDTSYVDYPSFGIAGENDEHLFVAIFPTDVQFDYENDEEAKGYHRLLNWVEQIHTAAESEVELLNPFSVVVG